MTDKAFDFMKTCLGYTIGMLIAMLAFWLVEAQDFIKFAEAKEMIQIHAPYVKDKPLIDDFLKRSQRDSDDMKALVRENNKVIHSLKIEIAVLNQHLRDKNE